MVQFNLINCFSINHETTTLIDAKIYLFHVERHVRGVITGLSERKGNTNINPHLFRKAEACVFALHVQAE